MPKREKATAPGVDAPEAVYGNPPATTPQEPLGAGDRDRTGDPELGNAGAEREKLAAGPELVPATFSDPEPGECPVCWDDDRVRSTLVNVREGGQSFIACLRCESEFYDTRCQLGGEHYDSMLAADCDRLTKEEERLGITQHMCHALAGQALKDAGVVLPLAEGSSQPEQVTPPPTATEQELHARALRAEAEAANLRQELERERRELARVRGDLVEVIEQRDIARAAAVAR